MERCLSEDLRNRVVAAVEQGSSRRAAAARFGVSSAIRWTAVAERKDITLAELQDLLAGRGVHFGIGTLWRFFVRHAITLKKRRRTRPSSNAPM